MRDYFKNKNKKVNCKIPKVSHTYINVGARARVHTHTHTQSSHISAKKNVCTESGERQRERKR